MTIEDNIYPALLHDTQIILDVNTALMKLFRCERDLFIDRILVEILATEEFKSLGRLRMQLLREFGSLPNVIYPFLRCDGSIFYAETETRTYSSDGVYLVVFYYQTEG
jgi:hypothetical protein